MEYKNLKRSKYVGRKANFQEKVGPVYYLEPDVLSQFDVQMERKDTGTEVLRDSIAEMNLFFIDNGGLRLLQLGNFKKQ